MSVLNLVLATTLGAVGGWGTYALVDRFSRARHTFENPAAVIAPALLFPALGIKIGFNSAALLVYGAFGLVLVGVTLIDFRTQQIPLLITLPGALSGLALGAFVLPIGFASSLIGFAFGGGVLIAATLVEAARNREVGGGDWKYAAMIGAFLGWPGIIWALILTGVFGVAGALLLRRQGLDRNPQALGPWLSAGAAVSLLVA